MDFKLIPKIGVEPEKEGFVSRLRKDKWVYGLGAFVGLTLISGALLITRDSGTGTVPTRWGGDTKDAVAAGGGLGADGLPESRTLVKKLERAGGVPNAAGGGPLSVPGADMPFNMGDSGISGEAPGRESGVRGAKTAGGTGPHPQMDYMEGLDRGVKDSASGTKSKLPPGTPMGGGTKGGPPPKASWNKLGGGSAGSPASSSADFMRSFSGRSGGRDGLARFGAARYPKSKSATGTDSGGGDDPNGDGNSGNKKGSTLLARGPAGAASQALAASSLAAARGKGASTMDTRTVGGGAGVAGWKAVDSFDDERGAFVDEMNAKYENAEARAQAEIRAIEQAAAADRDAAVSAAEAAAEFQRRQQEEEAARLEAQRQVELARIQNEQLAKDAKAVIEAQQKQIEQLQNSSVQQLQQQQQQQQTQQQPQAEFEFQIPEPEPQPQSPPKPACGTLCTITTGVIGGAATGAAIGGLIGGAPGAVAGAVIGGVAGGVVAAGGLLMGWLKGG